ncbi:MAG: single-stranded-DNA-specific exonuclease RecJ [Candidatus Cloacimonetes bacterium]|nr:single-stranded-DNA-specific exonuclease RecJ [Candidatus Cloacimonadota bacterium]
MEKRWKIAPHLSSEESQLKKSIVEQLHFPEIITDILLRKSLTDVEAIKQFFEPSLANAHDPFLFNDMEKAVERLEQAVTRKERITIYGDYDVDGTTATALLYLGLRMVDADIHFYIPHRMTDGYGLSLSSIQQLRDGGTNLIITVDCGINAVEETASINELGMDIIITDHHNPKETLPQAVAILNPKVVDCPYPYKSLAGVGVAYKLLMGYFIRKGMDSEENVNRFLDLVAVGTIADIVPLTGENRIFAKVGLERLALKRNIGLNALINISGLANKEINTADIVFGLAPRINAAGRMGSAMRAVELLISKTDGEAKELAQVIERENTSRQEIDQKTFREACEQIDRKYGKLEETYCIVVASDNWHPGVIGIVASKLVEKYYRPTIMIALNDGVGSGSGRSISEFDLFDALSQVEDMLESFGGHKYAAGLSILPEYLETFEEKLNEWVRQHLKPDQLIPPLKVDHHIELHKINDSLISWLEKFAPFGPGNMRLNFHSKNVMVVGYPYTVGRNHLKMKVKKDGCVLDLIGFNMGGLLPFLKRNTYIDIAYSLEWNTWQDKTTIQGKLKDIHFDWKN